MCMCDCIWAIPLRERLCHMFITFLLVLLTPVQGGEHHMIADVVNDLRGMVSVHVLCLGCLPVRRLSCTSLTSSVSLVRRSFAQVATKCKLGGVYLEAKEGLYMETYQWCAGHWLSMMVNDWLMTWLLVDLTIMQPLVKLVIVPVCTWCLTSVVNNDFWNRGSKVLAAAIHEQT